MGLYENLKICSGKDSVRKVKRQAREWEKTHVCDKGLANMRQKTSTEGL